jgi:hypothetical protein
VHSNAAEASNGMHQRFQQNLFYRQTAVCTA